ncbi:MAG: SH3 domain-containing protein, partial [Clostridia bacterium]|nr:SH3 domain-containing protein [Clostridia bacterium]
MKKLILCIVALILILYGASALAAGSDEALITDTLRQAGITEPVQLSQWGDTAACFAETNGVKRLILLERHDGAWQIVIDNPTALIQDRDWPQLLLDSDNAVFWTYILSDQEIVRYHSSRNADGTWSPVDQYFSDSGYGAYAHIWSTLWDDAHGGEIVRTFGMVNENENDHGIQLMEVLPATWMADCVRLADFDVSRFPTFFAETNDHFAFENERFFREAAAALMPEYAFVKGMLKNGAMHFLMEKPDGSRVYVICEYMSHRAVNLIESSPLPAGTVLGHENFTDSLWIDGRCVTVHLLYSGKAGLEYIYDDAGGEDAFLFFGDRTVWSGAQVPATCILYGDHPWDDITEIDWTRPPRRLDEAAERMDSSRYAMVVNPNPADRLHLRERADKGSRSQGKYYTGTPVEVLSVEGDWVQVAIGGQRGFMMRRYLTFGQAGDALYLDLSAMPPLSARDEKLKVYAEPQIGEYEWHMNEDWNTMRVIGIIGDEWYHVWFPATGEYGFV